MNIRAVLLAVLLGAPLVASAGLAADAGDPSLVNAVKRGDREAVEAGPATTSAAVRRASIRVTGPGSFPGLPPPGNLRG